MEHVTEDRARILLEQAGRVEVAVLGDVMLDHYYWGTVNRVSPEAPVPVVDLDTETYHLGGAANVAANIRALGASASLFGVVGTDPAGDHLRSLAERGGLQAEGIIRSDTRPTTVKTRIIGNNQQLLRLDRETRSAVDASVIDAVRSALRQRSALQAVILEDYDKGFLSAPMIESVIALAKELGIPVFVDPKKTHTQAYRGCFLFKPNRKEAADMLGTPLRTTDDVLRAGEQLLQLVDCSYVLITLGSQGMMLFERGGAVSSVPTVAKNVADVSGAGDTAIATLATLVACGATVREAAGLANIAAGVVVAEPGIVSITTEALLHATRESALHGAGNA